MNPESVKELLKQVHYPGFSRDIVSFGLVKDVQVENGNVTVHITLQTNDAKAPEKIFKDCHTVLDDAPGISNVHVELDIQEPATQTGNAGTSGTKTGIPGVKKIIAVASGKGGVGKSTVSANLAAALSAKGHKVGICDCDLYGPSIAHMFGTSERPLATEKNEIIPIRAHGLQLMSMGFLLEKASPVIVRGPLAHPVHPAVSP